MVLNTFKSGIFPLQPTEGTGNPDISTRVAKVFNHSCLKKLTPKQMIQMLPIDFVQVKAGNTPENLLNQICEIIYSLY